MRTFRSKHRGQAKDTAAVRRLTDKAPAHLMLWGRIGATFLFASFGSGVWLAYCASQGSIPFGIRALFSLSTTFGIYAAGRALRGENIALLHGSAHWADISTPSRREEVGLATVPQLPVLASESFFLGTDHGAMIALPPELARLHGLVIGGTGTGKSRGFFLPNAAFLRSDSIVCTDPKSELWLHTSGFHRKATRYAPTEPEQSASFNWIPLCREARYAELSARALIESGEEGPQRTEAVWIDSETAYLAALFAHAATLPQPTPLTAYRLFTRHKQEDLIALLKESSSEVAQEQANIFEQTQDRMRGSIVPAVAAKLQFLRDPDIARFTSADFAMPSFGRLRHRPEAVYWCMQEYDIERLRPLTSLFFTVALEQIGRAAPPNCPDAVPVKVLIDEFANIGTLPQFDTTVSLARSRGLSLWLGIQGLSQLEKRYGKPAAQTILANCATKIVLFGLDIDSAEYVSRMLGQTTIVTERRGWGLKSLFGPTDSVSYRETETARPLFTADEVRRIGVRDAIVVSANCAPVLLKRYNYSLAPVPGTASTLAEAQAAPLLENGPKAGGSVPPPFPDDLVPAESDSGVGSKVRAAKSKIASAFQIRRIPRAAQCIRVNKDSETKAKASPSANTPDADKIDL